jgi:hypothetical protein
MLASVNCSEGEELEVTVERRWWGNGRRMSIGRRMIHDRRRARAMIPAERRTGYDQRDDGDRRSWDERRWLGTPPKGTLTM